MAKKKKVNATPDSIVLGISGEALLVMGLVVALAGKPQWDSILCVAIAVTGLFLTIWAVALSKKRQAAGENILTLILAVMGVLSFMGGIVGYLKLLTVFAVGIMAAIIGVLSDIVLAVVAKRGKQQEA